ncbi:nuclease [Methanobrevibacter sp. TMH8]|uniref:nuclease n=1 Tax=Methanobrevibacter sp. TMH8 TaxID=2848611 RepID=UPI001CCDC981|nr:nuclease [Methanobrevibacter sp. TMH8]MBZ9570732.1 nuclease [Methanobrevibacter sp. TMH8]
MFEEEKDNKIYNLLISNGNDPNKEYPKFVEALYSKNEFLWKESAAGNYEHMTENFLKKLDVVIILSGLYDKNKKDIDNIVKAAQKFNIPIILVRPHGLEEVPENLESVATGLVGWNANCIIDTIKGALELDSEGQCEI